MQDLAAHRRQTSASTTTSGPARQVFRWHSTYRRKTALIRNAPIAIGEIGQTGVSIAHIGDMETLFLGIDLARVNTSMTINATAPFILALYLVHAERTGVPWKDLRGTVQNDLLKEFVARGTSIFSPAVSLRLSTDLIAFTAVSVPQWNPINVCGYHYMESGASPHEEIGYSLANILLLLDAVRPQLSKEHFEAVVRRISFFINSGIELVPEICKVRAYSTLWTRLCSSEYGISDVPFRAGCQVRSISLTAQQPENNIVRIALQALPAILSASARVNALQLPGFREALTLPDQVEQKLSIRTQQILMNETKIAEYGDIFAGNRIIEDMTAEFEQKARELAMQLRASGYEQTIGTVDRRLGEAIIARERRINDGSDIIVGLNAFTDPVGLSEQLSISDGRTAEASSDADRIRAIQKWKTEETASARKAEDELRNVLREGGRASCLRQSGSHGREALLVNGRKRLHRRQTDAFRFRSHQGRQANKASDGSKAKRMHLPAWFSRRLDWMGTPTESRSWLLPSATRGSR